MLKDGDRAETLERLIGERGPKYAEAHIRIPSSGGSHAEVVDAIVAALQEHVTGA
jgi:shikimate kinase